MKKLLKSKEMRLSILALVIVLILTIAASYAYFVATTSGNDAKNVYLKTAQLGINYAHGDKISSHSDENALNIKEDWEAYLPMSVTNTGTISQLYNIRWDKITKNTIVGYANTSANPQIENCIEGTSGCIDVRNDFTWTMYELSTEPDDTSLLTMKTSAEAGITKATGYLYGTKSNDLLLEDENIAPSTTKYYVLKLSFNYDDVNPQNYQQGKEFTGKIKVTIDNNPVETARAFVGNPRDWTVSAEPNETGGYTLEEFNGDLDTMTVADGVTRTENYWTDENISPMYLSLFEISSVSEMEPGTNVAYDVIIPSVVDGKNITELGPDLVSGTSMDESINFKNLRIKSLTISEGIKELKSAEPYEGEWFGSFMYLINNNDLSLPESLEVINGMSFAMNSITSLELPSNLVSIMDAAFYFSMKLSSVEIPASVEYIGTSVFGDSPLTELTFETDNGISSLRTIGEEAFKASSSSETKITSLILPEGLETIGEKAFQNQAITSIIIPSSVVTIDRYAFEGNQLSSIVFAGTSTNGSGNDTSSLTTIGQYAFEGTNTFASVYIPSSVTTMEQGAFGTSLTTTKLYLNKTSIPGTFMNESGYHWNAKYRYERYETWILDGSGNYTMYSAYTG